MKNNAVSFKYILAIMFFGIFFIMLLPTAAVFPKYAHMTLHDHLGLAFSGSCLIAVSGVLCCQKFREDMGVFYRKTMTAALLQYAFSASLTVLFSAGII